MSTKAPARSEQEKNPAVNLSTLPKEEVLKRAHDAGRKFFLNENIIQSVAMDVWTGWMNENLPCSIGQTEDEFGDLVNEAMDEFLCGMTSGISDARANEKLIDDSARARLEMTVNGLTQSTRHVHHALTFMLESMVEDVKGSLPVKCTLTQLWLDLEKIASDLMDVEHSIHCSRL